MFFTFFLLPGMPGSDQIIMPEFKWGSNINCRAPVALKQVARAHGPAQFSFPRHEVPQGSATGSKHLPIVKGAFAALVRRVLRGMKLVMWMALAGFPALAQTPGIDEIMSRVAANQAQSVEARKQYVYRQEQLFSLHRANGMLACQQKWEYTVTPVPDGIVKHVVKSETKGQGHCGPPTSETASGAQHTVGDSGVTVSWDEIGHGHSADGVPYDLFPLTAREQRKYSYQIEGSEAYHGRQVYRIGFRPNHVRDEDGEEGYWKGETLVDAAEFQPVLVTTDLTAKVPAAVRVLLGTNVRGVGFTVSYERMPDGIWFPAGFGGEFELRALFFYKRTISVNVTNSDFRRTDVVSSLAFDTDKQ